MMARLSEILKLGLKEARKNKKDVFMTKSELHELPIYQIWEWVKDNIELTTEQLDILDNLEDDDFRICVRDNFIE